jgi:mono/diheme cytochrome c family protein
MKRSCVRHFVLAAVLVAASPFVYAEGGDIGKQEYFSKCAACHGKEARGNGPVADSLKVKVPDLTVLAKNSGGVFPFARVYDVIDGREAVAAHGPRNMPVWGNEYWQEGAGASGREASQPELGSYARGRIIALIGYISTLQVK